MKVMQIFFFLVLLNVSFFLLNVTGIYYYDDPNPSFDFYSWSNAEIVLLVAFAFGTAATAGTYLARWGVNPYMTAAYTVFLTTFATLYGMFVKVLNGIGDSMGDAKVIMSTFLIILTIVMAILMLYTAMQMAIGGGKGFE